MVNSYDPLGHIKILVANVKGSKEFYKKIFNKLEWKNIKEEDFGASWVSPEGFGFSIKEAEHKEHEYKFGSPGIHHFCFKAKSKGKVDEFYELLLKEGVEICDAPAAYPEYTEDYYAVFFFDPDGIKLELAYY